MFKGVVHANARAILLDLIPKLPARAINVCSGNFTLETTLRMNGFAGRLEGCDISLYTCSLGAYLSGQDLVIRLAANVDPELEVFRPMFADPIGQAAAVAILLDLSEHAPRKNAFQKRMWHAVVSQAQQLYEGTLKRLEKKKGLVKLDGFYARDGVEVINSIKDDPETFVISFPPTYSGGYEKLYKWLDSVVSWNQPTYTNIGQEEDFAKLITSIKGKWALGTEYRDAAVEAIVGQPIAQASRGAAKNVFLYSNIPAKPLLVRRKVECTEANWPRLTDADTLTGKERITFHRVTFKEANYFRQLFSSVIPMPASAQFCYVFAIDGKVFGQVMMSLPTFGAVVEGQNIGAQCLYLMSDLPVTLENHPRLSKLVLAALCSKEMQTELEHRTMQSVKFIFTTAFSHNPASMKYRGAFKLHSRKKTDSGVWSINYYAHIGQKRMRALYAEWLQKQQSLKSKDVANE
jgi:hypothetical protein